MLLQLSLIARFGEAPQQAFLRPPAQQKFRSVATPELLTACRLYTPLKSRIYLTFIQVYDNLKVGVVYIARNIKIKVARAELDMTQKALAEAVGISRQTVNSIEQGNYNPKIEICRRICNVLGKSLDDLFGEEK